MKQALMILLTAFMTASSAFAAVPKSTKVSTLKESAKVSAKESAPQAGSVADRDAMVDALASPDYAKAKKLHKKGISYDALASGDDMTGLMRVSDDGIQEAVKAILALGANINASNSMGESAVWYATYSGHEDLALSLIARGATVSTQRKDSGECLLHIAVQTDMVKLSKKLMKLTPQCAGIKDRDGHTPADVAKSLGYKKIAKIVSPVTRK